MSKRIAGIFVILFFITSISSAHAASGNLVEAMGQKALRGFVNLVTGWVEIPAQIIKGHERGFMGDSDKKLLGAVIGIFKGFGAFAGRTASGAVDLGTFWAADPESNDGIGFPLDAEYAWESGAPYDMFSPNFTDGAVMPVGKKLVRGLSNSLLGILELPGQISKGASEGEVVTGIVKGIWYWFSREIDGAYDLVTIILPVPEENKGVAFDGEYPWTALAGQVSK